MLPWSKAHFVMRQRSSRIWGFACLLATAAGVAAIVLLPAAPLHVRVVPQRPTAGPLPWLSTRGDRIVNSSGETVLLRGFNDSSLLQVGDSPLPSPLSNRDAALMEAEGFDVVRLPISWSLLEPSPGHYSRSYLQAIERAVNICAAHHLYVVLDMHTEDFGVGFGGSGAPAWLYVAGIPDLHIPGLSAAWQRHLSPAVNAALAYFWLFPTWQSYYWQTWDYVARRFRDDSAVAGYDLYNEPHPFPIPPAIFETQILFPFYQHGISKIARVDPNHLFIVEGDFFGGEPTAVRPLSGRDLVFSTHLYSGSLLPPTFEGDTAPLRAELSQGIHEADQLPGPYWSGELGIGKTTPHARQWAQDEIALSNQYLTGWAWWQWDDPGEWGVRRGTGPPDLSWLRALAEPFVRASPGVLERMTYSVSRRLLTAQIDSVVPESSVQLSWPRWLGRPRLLSRCTAMVSDDWTAGSVSLRLSTGTCEVRVS